MTDPQIIASDPEISAFVTANAGSGKTSTLVNRVARLLLRGAKPETILCVTYTKAAAAEMQRRLYERLGRWAGMGDDDALSESLADIDEHQSKPSVARALFAQALETPGGLKIQTIHGFCEKLLRRFPLEAGVAPGFRVLEDQAAREISARARDDVARAALERPEGAIGRAYAHFAVTLDYRSFQDMFAAFEARRSEIHAYVEACREQDGVEADVWRSCSFEAAESVDEIRTAAAAPPELDPDLWTAAARALSAGAARDQACSTRMAAVAEQAKAGQAKFDEALGVFCTAKREPAKWVDTTAALKADPVLRERLLGERERLFRALERARAAQVAQDTISALYLASTYGALYEAAKAAVGALDFADLIARTHELLTIRADAAWVLFKLDGGVDHVLVDEAQDTSPDQWDILRPLTAEFFAGAGAQDARRTMFAVGDEKQSIYSFQGAVLERFAKETAEYEDLIQGAGRTFKQPALIRSWRSTPEVLTFVDAVFADPAASRALRAEGSGTGAPAHEPGPDAGAGSVDIWPLEETDPAVETDAWAPVDAESAESGNRKLARRIARTINAMVTGGEAVWVKGARERRPMGYGDVLILVRRRGALFQEIIRALKREGAPVGGADRLSLSDHIVFHDLTGLARICLFPWDDLTLAALLRSPLCDIDEGALYDLAYGREGRPLWDVLHARAGERASWRAALELFAWARQECRRRPPFEFFARLLARADGQGRSMRARILTRLGREAEQALDAFLAEALAAERRGVRDLETFAADMAASAVEVKREQDEGKGEVRVMTVHGAKGLEAPVVILPDTATKASPRGAPLLATGDGGFLWCARKADDCEASAAARQERSDAADRESLRLLYVALTRARDRLIVCGVAPGQPARQADSWWDYVGRAQGHPEVAKRARELTDAEGRTVLRFGDDPAPAEGRLAVERSAGSAPDWMSRPAPVEPPAWRYASPSQMSEAAKGPSPSPLAEVGGLGRFRRGDLIHKLLQALPDLEPDRRARSARVLLEREPDLTPGQREEMAAAALAVLEDHRFAAVFGPGSRAEVAVAGGAPQLGDLRVSGRIDRLVVEPHRVLVADYKTNRPSPDRIEDADPAYITQMAVYAAVLRSAFPGRTVEDALVWTDGPKLMTVPENLMAKALDALPPSS